MAQEILGLRLESLFSLPELEHLLMFLLHYGERMLGPIRPRNSKLISTFMHQNYSGENLKQYNHRSLWICVGDKLVQGNHTIVALLSSSKSSSFKRSFVNSKTQSRRFQIFLVKLTVSAHFNRIYSRLPPTDHIIDQKK